MYVFIKILKGHRECVGVKILKLTLFNKRVWNKEEVVFYCIQNINPSLSHHELKFGDFMVHSVFE